MRNLILAGAIAIAGLTFVDAPASAQGVWIDTPVGGVHVGRDRDRYYDRRRGYDAYGYERGYRRGRLNCGPGMNSDGHGRCVPIRHRYYR